MDEYIEREAVLAKQHTSHVKSDRGCVDYYHRCIDSGDVEEIPAADVVPVRHGRWEPLTMSTDNGMEVLWVHAECGCERYEKSNYCPNCGARMDGDGE